MPKHQDSIRLRRRPKGEGAIPIELSRLHQIPYLRDQLGQGLNLAVLMMIIDQSHLDPHFHLYYFFVFLHLATLVPSPKLKQHIIFTLCWTSPIANQDARDFLLARLCCGSCYSRLSQRLKTINSSASLSFPVHLHVIYIDKFPWPKYTWSIVQSIFASCCLRCVSIATYLYYILLLSDITATCPNQSVSTLSKNYITSAFDSCILPENYDSRNNDGERGRTQTVRSIVPARLGRTYS